MAHFSATQARAVLAHQFIQQSTQRSLVCEGALGQAAVLRK